MSTVRMRYDAEAQRALSDLMKAVPRLGPLRLASVTDKGSEFLEVHSSDGALVRLVDRGQGAAEIVEAALGVLREFAESTPDPLPARAPSPARSAPPGAEAALTLSSERTVVLRSGGALSIAAEVNLFALAPADRDFLFRLSDLLDGYEREPKA